MLTINKNIAFLLEMNSQPLSHLEIDQLKRIRGMGKEGRTFCMIVLASWLLIFLGLGLAGLGARTGLTKPMTFNLSAELLPPETAVGSYNFLISREGLAAPQGAPSWKIVVYSVGFVTFTMALWLAGVWMALGVFIEYSKGEAFSHEAALRIQWIGRILLIGGIGALLLHLYSMVAYVVSPLSDSVAISLGYEKWLLPTLVGYFVLAVGRVMAQAVTIKAEQDLTI
jgi:hypothetical protein